jgi:hypothetical protein
MMNVISNTSSRRPSQWQGNQSLADASAWLISCRSQESLPFQREQDAWLGKKEKNYARQGEMVMDSQSWD